jgi:hypothetical protein
MGIYYGDKIYGVKLIKNEATLYHKITENEISSEEIEDIKKIYDELTNQYGDICVYIYVEMTTTYNYPPLTDKSWLLTTIGHLDEKV